MRIVYTIVADCDSPPSDLYFEQENDLLSQLEDEVAGRLINHAASFAIETSKQVHL